MTPAAANAPTASADRPLEVVAAGEILWDVFPDGARFGGAPANFACHYAALAGRATLFSAVGDDALGRRALEELTRRGVLTDHVRQSSDRATGVVAVTFDDRGQPRYAFGADEAWDHLAWSDSLDSLAREADAICFGTLGQRGAASRESIRQLLAAARHDCLRVLDLNLRPPFYSPALIAESLERCSVLKMNGAELIVVSEQLGLYGDERDQVAALAERFYLRAVAITRGEAGSLLWRDGERDEMTSLGVRVVDTVGAGDAFAAALVDGLLRELPLAQLHQRAARAAAQTCAHAGALPEP
jgi:fructokinase